MIFLLFTQSCLLNLISESDYVIQRKLLQRCSDGQSTAERNGVVFRPSFSRAALSYPYFFQSEVLAYKQ